MIRSFRCLAISLHGITSTALQNHDARRSFNRSEEDFGGDLRAYNDYLEEKENLIYDLTNGTKEEAEQANARVRAYEEEHRIEITKNAAKK